MIKSIYLTKFEKIKKIIKSFFNIFLRVNSKIIENLNRFLNTLRIWVYYQDNRGRITDSFLFSGFILLIFKTIYFITFHSYSPSVLNILILIFITILAYKFYLILFLRKYFYYNIFIKFVPEKSVSRYSIPPDILEDIVENNDISPYNLEKSKSQIIFEKIWSLFNLIRLFIFTEPYLFLIARPILFYFLIFNKLYFITIILTFIILLSRFLFHFSDLDHLSYQFFYNELKERYFYYSKYPEAMENLTIRDNFPLVINYELWENGEAIIAPTLKNAESMYYWSIREFCDGFIYEYSHKENSEYWEMHKKHYIEETVKSRLEFLFGEEKDEYILALYVKSPRLKEAPPLYSSVGAINSDAKLQLFSNINERVPLYLLTNQINVLGKLTLVIITSITVMYLLINFEIISEINFENIIEMAGPVTTGKKGMVIIENNKLKNKIVEIYNKNNSENKENLKKNTLVTPFTEKDNNFLNLKSDPDNHPVIITEHLNGDITLEKESTFNTNKSTLHNNMPNYLNIEQGKIYGSSGTKYCFKNNTEENDYLRAMTNSPDRILHTNNSEIGHAFLNSFSNKIYIDSKFAKNIQNEQAITKIEKKLCNISPGKNYSESLINSLQLLKDNESSKIIAISLIKEALNNDKALDDDKKREIVEELKRFPALKFDLEYKFLEFNSNNINAVKKMIIEESLSAKEKDERKEKKINENLNQNNLYNPRISKIYRTIIKTKQPTEEIQDLDIVIIPSKYSLEENKIYQTIEKNEKGSISNGQPFNITKDILQKCTNINLAAAYHKQKYQERLQGRKEIGYKLNKTFNLGNTQIKAISNKNKSLNEQD